MSELLNSLNVPSETPAKTWASEVAEVAASEPAPAATEASSSEPAPAQPEPFEPAVEAPETQETAPEEPDRRVPLKALQEERQKRAQYEQMLMQREQEMMQMRAWIEQQQVQAQPQEQFTEPDPETDPIGALKYTKEQLRQMQEMTLQQQEAMAQQQYVAQLSDVAYQAAAQAQQAVPDYNDAYRYAINSRARELMALGTPQHDIPAILQQEELRLIDTSVRNGRNPAQAIYEFAKARGFNSTAAKPTASAPDPVMAQAKAAVAASASAGGAPASKGAISPADLANLNGAAFDSAWNKLFGGNKSSVFRE